MRTLLMCLALVALAWTGAAQEPTDGRTDIRHMDDPALRSVADDPSWRVSQAFQQSEQTDARINAMQRRIDAGENAHVQVVRVEQWDRITIQLMRIADALEAWVQNYDTGSEARIKQLEKRIDSLERKLTQSTKDK